MSTSVLERIVASGIVPVIKIDSPEKVLGLGRALQAGGLAVAEITFRTDSAAASIQRMAAELPETLVGAGTVINRSQAEQAVAAGASFIVSPGYTDEVVEYCQEQNVLVIPGINTPTGVQYGISRGIQLFKLFPAEISGGVRMLDALRGPFPQASFLPTGGINMDNVADYIRRPNVVAVGGSWMVPPDLVAIEDWDSITRLSQLAVAAAGR
ncbi:bifunctional 4-hydroxy-2-oxoglutarate aldolase/2-dehydro-3-deoxy-phosphogluconate aldolase [Spirochaeta africana]|uniref:2-dehydro-3-deoxy-phosphogluconate aldolase n=1 Tax=Spirochaeta africana (strain ATCC 700263 / DSM 8902 / Z-7692) TaxID=889378 RepID=H9UK66_SPIAZ|nr:bifunctional 4-hydroxy-2-oxoglutarate aldolase/2-dehydro-3-deoxy-phosphogluconate aldolase [Spirochaeta africana]AFG37909.1 Entner-Doudoroff aldolase [Spirochaeta africana DSM 8902]